MYSLVIMSDNTILHIGKLLRDRILKILIIGKICNYVWWQMLPRLTVVIILPYVQIYDISYISIKNSDYPKLKKNKT